MKSEQIQTKYLRPLWLFAHSKLRLDIQALFRQIEKLKLSCLPLIQIDNELYVVLNDNANIIPSYKSNIRTVA